jgi:hypothetical protein
MARRTKWFEELTLTDFEVQYEEELIERDIKKDSEEYYELYTDACTMNFEDFMSNLKYSNNNQPCVIIGSLGLWNGKHTIYPVVMDNVVDAIYKCLGNDAITMDIYKVNGYLEVNIYHHDGCNTFEIHLLNNKGLNAGENANMYNKCYHKAMSRYLF